MQLTLQLGDRTFARVAEEARGEGLAPDAWVTRLIDRELRSRGALRLTSVCTDKMRSALGLPVRPPTKAEMVLLHSELRRLSVGADRIVELVDEYLRRNAERQSVLMRRRPWRVFIDALPELAAGTYQGERPGALSGVSSEERARRQALLSAIADPEERARVAAREGWT